VRGGVSGSPSLAWILHGPPPTRAGWQGRIRSGTGAWGALEDLEEPEVRVLEAGKISRGSWSARLNGEVFPPAARALADRGFPFPGPRRSGSPSEEEGAPVSPCETSP